jgi:hypothetical protein
MSRLLVVIATVIGTLFGTGAEAASPPAGTTALQPVQERLTVQDPSPEQQRQWIADMTRSRKSELESSVPAKADSVEPRTQSARSGCDAGRDDSDDRCDR